MLFFMPLSAKAGFFSSILSNEAQANENTDNFTDSSKNSQTMELLQANVFSALVLQDKKDNKKDDKQNNKDGEIDANADVNIVSNNALLPKVGPSSGAGDIPENLSSDQVSVYVVRKGDSVGEIADMFGVSVNTIRWANDIKAGEKLKEGDVLIILPISGVKHIITKGQTLKNIAKLYKVDVSDITDFNEITDSTKLIPGDELIIPGAEITNEVIEKPKTTAKIIIKDSLQFLSGYFINPVPGYKRKSQGIHGNNGVDLAAPTGTPIVASASGTIIFARTGRNGGYGNLVIISHSNGTETLYAHQSKITTQVGDQVSQGEVIGYVGSTGRSTGPHLHYEIHGARNNAVDL